MWVEHERGIEIQHALKRGGEHKVSDGKGGFYKLDGFCAEQNLVLEFNGCVWHGCKMCFPNNRSAKKLGDPTVLKHPYNNTPMDVLYARTQQKKAHLESRGFTYLAMWECEWGQKVEDTPEIQNFLDTLDIQDRLNPKDSFFGGRTDGNYMYYHAAPDETIEYVDFTSLYPTVQKLDPYPVGHPEIITDNFRNIDQYFGIAKIKILPPRQLALPVLPQKAFGKLTFPLCQTCSNTQSSSPCTHSDSERAMIGTWVTLEIQEAVRRGYEILQIYEVYHWDKVAQHGPGATGLFSEYVQRFLKLKTEASGWPQSCETPEQKQAFVNKFQEREGVNLDPDNIKKNPGLRSLAKLCLNSFWGKFGQRDCMTNSKYVTDEAEFFKTLADPTKKVVNWHILSEDMVLMDLQPSKDFIPGSNLTNIFIAAFTTCHARLRLYRLMMKISPEGADGSNLILYYDTDSIIYVRRPGGYVPECGDFLGDLTNELPRGRHIVEFVCCGPKNYGYKLDNGECYIKIKGFTLTHKASQSLHFNTLCDELFLWHFHGLSHNIQIENPSPITRDKHKYIIYNKPLSKSYQVVYTKRIVNPDLSTLPFGYCM